MGRTLGGAALLRLADPAHDGVAPGSASGTSDVGGGRDGIGGALGGVPAATAAQARERQAEMDWRERAAIRREEAEERAAVRRAEAEEQDKQRQEREQVRAEERRRWEAEQESRAKDREMMLELLRAALNK